MLCTGIKKSKKKALRIKALEKKKKRNWIMTLAYKQGKSVNISETCAK